MVATDSQAPQQKQTFRGLLDLLMKDEEMRKRIGQVGAASAQIAQPFDVQQPQPIGFSGGLLQQPQVAPMTPGTGIMGIDPSQGNGVDMEKIAKFMKILGMG
tara:strand:- start:3 stop:308 length:306 start_codon:yes stop_codon:yes gene_type:complete